MFTFIDRWQNMNICIRNETLSHTHTHIERGRFRSPQSFNTIDESRNGSSSKSQFVQLSLRVHVIYCNTNCVRLCCELPCLTLGAIYHGSEYLRSSDQSFLEGSKSCFHICAFTMKKNCNGSMFRASCQFNHECV